jgi:hypothetical protein
LVHPPGGFFLYLLCPPPPPPPGGEGGKQAGFFVLVSISLLIPSFKLVMPAPPCEWLQ